jgi:amino acid transporter
MSLRELLLGRRLRTEEEHAEQVGPREAIPVMGLDALASAAYGPEAMLTVLIPLGLAATRQVVGLSLAVVALLLAVYVSYRQTIAAYPGGGGAYTVARENLGPRMGLIAAAALCVDYLLNVAVAISAGVGAMVSAVPALLPHTLALCLAILVLLTVLNLRGVRTAGVLFMLPTYLFIGCLGGAVVVGLAHLVHSPPRAISHPAQAGTAAASTWIILRAYAAGCTALTGVEAVSNGVPLFRDPKVALARRTLGTIVLILAFLVLGVALIARGKGITATPPGHPGYQSVLSLVLTAVAGRGPFYYVSIAAILAVLALSADTSFTGFPRVCRQLALDAHLPPGFAHRGGRLVYTQGVVVLAVLSAVLLIAFGGVTDRLIPLFAVGAFTAFTLSQLGMVVHWWRRRRWHALAINAAGAVATAASLVIMVVAKFVEGAWLTILAFPLLVMLFHRFRRYHDRLERQVAEAHPLDAAGLHPPLVVIALGRLDRLAEKALRLGLAISPDVEAVQVLSDDIQIHDLSPRWDALVARPARAAGRQPPRLTVLSSPYRERFGPLIDHVRRRAAENRDRVVAVVVAELVERRWYHFLTSHQATLLTRLLLWRGGPRIVVVNAPWYLAR